MDDKGDIFKHKKYCIIHSCKKTALFNYENEKKIYIVMSINEII